MNTFTLINKIKNNIQKAIKPSSKQQNQTTMKTNPNIVIEAPANNSTPSFIEQPITMPPADVTPAVVNMIKSKQGELNNSGNDLGAYAMDTCVALNGKLNGFKNIMSVVVMNYKVEADSVKQDVQSELSSEINKLNNHIIKLNNEIHSIESFLIPEKIVELKNYEEQIASLMTNTEYGVSTSLSSERLVIMQLAAALNKELIRELKQKVVELKTEIDQTRLGIEGLDMQQSQINFFNEPALRRRLGLFFNHWLIALEGLDAEEGHIEETKEVFNQYLNEQIILLNVA